MNCGLSFDMLSDKIRAVSLVKMTNFVCALIIQIQSVFRFYISKITSFVCLCQSASLVCDSNPVVASQTRFAVHRHRMERRICANLNLTYS